MEKDLNSPTLAGSALMSVVNVNKEIQEQQMNIVGGEGTFLSQCHLHLIVLSCSTAKGILCGSAGAIGDKPGEGHQSGAARAEEIPAAAQGAHGELSEGGVHNEKAAQEKGNAREHREGA